MISRKVNGGMVQVLTEKFNEKFISLRQFIVETVFRFDVVDCSY